MTGGKAARAGAALHAIERVCAEGRDAQSLIEEIIERVVGVVDAEAFFAGATDPETGLCLGSGVVLGMSQSICHPFWEHEFCVPDYNKFVDLDAERPVADLHEATGGRVQRSARWRSFHAISDLDAELRAVLPAGGRTWGVLQLNRHSGSPRFDRDDLRFLEAVAPVAGEGLRAALLNEPSTSDVTGRGPGMVVLDEHGTIASATAEGEAWLAELRASDWLSCASGLPVPIEIFVAQVLRDPAPRRRARLRTETGVWLVLHASPLGADGQIALIIEPAKASEVAPVIVQAYGLTARELDVTRLVARGLKTAEIGRELHLSPHTVRDHLKSVFEKVGVSSRGELVSQLFAEHYQPGLDFSLTESKGRVADRLPSLA